MKKANKDLLPLTIRPATVNDLEDIRNIYNHAVQTSVFTMDLEEWTQEDMKRWVESHTERFPAFVGIVDKRIIGVAYLSKWAERKGYYPSCEASVYLSPESRSQGHGDRMLKHLIGCAIKNDFWTIIGFMTSTNKRAKNLLERNGFIFVGMMQQVGFKFNQSIDLAIYQLLLNDKNNRTLLSIRSRV